MTEYRHEDLTSLIIKSYYKVYNKLGPGFLENVYQNAMAHDLQSSELSVDQELPVNVHFEKVVVGKYFADLVVNDVVIIEIKAIESLTTRHDAQLLNYLKATQIEVGLLFNFGNTEPEFHRKIFTNDRKPHLFNPE